MASFAELVRMRTENFKPAQIKAAHIAWARKGLADYLRRQEQKPGYTIEVDGSPATSERSVKPFGVITYRFVRLEQITRSALAAAVLGSPKLSGRYRRSWFAMANGVELDTRAIPAGVREVLVTNDQPYSRKINVGARGFKAYAPPGVVERVKEQMKRRFGNLAKFRVIFITLDGGHVLKHDQFRRDKHGRRRSRNPRRDARAGSALTYPALEISIR
jgi:hypothetical protein